jgi:hypothetical protein
MAGRGARRGVSKAFAQNLELSNPKVQLVRLCRKHGAIDPRGTAGGKHAGDLAEREAGGSTKGDQCQAFKDFGVEKPPEPSSADGGDQALLLIIAKGGSGNAGTARYLRDINVTHPLDLKSA